MEKEFEFEGKKYIIKSITLGEDLNIQEQCTDPISGKFKMNDYLIMRLARCLVEPKMLTDDLKQLDDKIGNFLLAACSILNDVNPTSFLETLKPADNIG